MLYSNVAVRSEFKIKISTHELHLAFTHGEYSLESTASCREGKRCSLPCRGVRSYMEGRWEGKGTYVFYLELVTDLLHLCVYVVFFFIVFTNYGLPLHLVRSHCVQ